MSGSQFFSVQRLTDVIKIVKHKPYETKRFVFGGAFDDTELVDSNEKTATLKIWQMPVKGGQYLVGGDPAWGSSEWADRFALNVSRCWADGVEQVAHQEDAQTHHAGEDGDQRAIDDPRVAAVLRLLGEDHLLVLRARTPDGEPAATGIFPGLAGATAMEVAPHGDPLSASARDLNALMRAKQDRVAAAVPGGEVLLTGQQAYSAPEHAETAGARQVHAALGVRERLAVEAGGNFLRVRGVWQKVTRELLDAELIEWQVAVDCVDHGRSLGLAVSVVRHVADECQAELVRV